MLKDILQISSGVTCVIGSGGKTTLLAALGRELSRFGTVILTTSTHIFPFADIPLAKNLQELQQFLQGHRIVCAGAPTEHGKLTAPPISPEHLAQAADFVLVEADGSKGLPMKAHLPHEPVLWTQRKQTICVVGASGFGKPISICAHRAERFAELGECCMDDAVTPEILSRVLRKEALADRVFVNQVHTPRELSLAKQLQLSCPLAAGSLQKEQYLCLY